MGENRVGIARLFMMALAAPTFLLATFAHASTVTFVPPNDPVGAVFSTNSNDGYAFARGVVFQVTSTTTIDSVGIFQDLTNVLLSYNVWDTPTTSGNVNSGATLVTSGSVLANTNGLEWIDFAIAPVALVAGNNYHIEFAFAGNSNQNFFYNNQNVPFTQGAFQLIDGTLGGDTDNFVMPAVRINTLDASPVPLPPAVLPGLALLGVVAVRRKIAAA